ncbi:glycosyltransferase [Aetokthonos hydrillicola Thurmond2011]|uniref:Glycosyltransferase n=1 Tax=Aetokthonos hydrillicola Thurmond2011 TaxID=2712845 RepID=A0AAP5I5J9_9CYAN|nr:glycosyltransferase [Aetokthonos hydrillicola]MDR9895186.1 glycosyltransferase [Aetokthonos hydrillicola Thurmond2011]
MPLVSVVIPAFNAEKTIRQTIESAVNQTLTDIEIIVINDGSTDSTAKVIEIVTDSRLQVFSYPNEGVAVSRNRGISKAVGEFISFLDADDLWTPNKLESQVNALREHPEATVAYSWVNFIDTDGDFLYPGYRFTLTGDVYSKLFVQNFLDNGSNILVRTEALQTVGGFEQSVSPAEDWDIALRLAARYQFVVVPEAQILYRLSANTLSSNLYRQETVTLKVIERALDNNEKGKSVQHLKKYSLGKIYKYLSVKAVQAPVEKQKSWVNARFLWCSVRNDPSILKERKFMIIMVFKAMFPRLYNNFRKIKAFIT